jgi:outer membrane protein OmpU
MKNIIKTVIVMLTSISLFTSANAGALGVNGTAKATYNILSGDKTNVGKGLGITNELNFTASGELDNGYTWSYSMELDPTDAASAGVASNDDTKLTLSTPMGTVGVFISEGGLDLEDGASQSVYARPTDTGDKSATSDNFTIDAYNNVQFHTPADLLPFGLTAKIAYAPDLDNTINSGNASGGTKVEGGSAFAGTNATEYQVKANPIGGLNIGASYMTFDNGGLKAGNDQEAEGGAYMATYAQGPFTVGYSKAYKAPQLAGTIANSATGGAGDATSQSVGVEHFIQSNASIAYAASDDLSISYEVEKSEANYAEASRAAVEQESSAVQVAYTMGGMTIAVSHGSYDNNGYTAGITSNQTLLAVTMAF